MKRTVLRLSSSCPWSLAFCHCRVFLRAEPGLEGRSVHPSLSVSIHPLALLPDVVSLVWVLACKIFHNKERNELFVCDLCGVGGDGPKALPVLATCFP